MKKMMMTIGLVLLVAAAYSQTSENYWVVETDSARRCVVKIYNSENKLVSETPVERRIDINKKKVRRMLNRMAGSHENAGQALWSKR
jgi:hypothetical protein